MNSPRQNPATFGSEAMHAPPKTFPLHDMRSSGLGTPAETSKPVTTDETIENPIAVINTLQKQIEHLEAALRRQNEIDRSDFGMDVRNVLFGLRAQAIIPLYLGKSKRSEAIGHMGINLYEPHASIVDELLRDHLWMLDDAPIPDEMKEAIRESCQYGCNRWEYQTSSHSKQA